GRLENYPVRLFHSPANWSTPPHEYGPGVVNQPWFSEPTFPENLNQRWEIGFHYIATEAIAPIFIGEFGGRQVDQRSREGIWQRRLVDFIKRHDLSFSYWSWNPNSGDTGGILLDDWQTIDSPKQDLLSSTLSNIGSVASATTAALPRSNPPIPTSTPSPAPSPTSSPTPPSEISFTNTGLRVNSLMQSDWQTGFCFSMQVVNRGTTSAGGWGLSFQMNQAEISNSWNGTFIRQGDRYTVIPPEWGQAIQPGQTVDLGFCATKQGANYYPQNVMITPP
ncbi:MAG: cellulase family glycosylhydrolase, partial [Leptolyngbyaceae cyanobacterium SL_7_1]|nr:cellulase family glycosylhydrolase [Leptolyngbyaceae cyanobacterium SL_7_1]